MKVEQTHDTLSNMLKCSCNLICLNELKHCLNNNFLEYSPKHKHKQIIDRVTRAWRLWKTTRDWFEIIFWVYEKRGKEIWDNIKQGLMSTDLEIRNIKNHEPLVQEETQSIKN